MEKKTIEEILAIEPRLQKVLDRAKAGYKEGVEDWPLYEACKRDATILVGSFCRNAELTSNQDYATVIWALADILHV